MFIKKLEIENFRSIKHLIIDPSNLCAIIGPNSSGKTNILKAIDLVLGEGWTTKAKIARELFNDVSKPIKIVLFFDQPVDYTYSSKYGPKTLSVNSIELEMRLQPELFAKTTINNGGDFYGQEQFKKQCHFIYISSERQLTDELRVSEWTMLGKLMRLIYENYISNKGDEENLKNEFATKIKPAKEYLENDFDKNSITFKKFSDKFKKYCRGNSSGFATDFEPMLNIYNLNWFYKTLQINVFEGEENKNFNSEDVGAGVQNLLLISIFQTYAELMGGKVIFGIEEPEIYLYPNAQRALYNNLIGLSEETQIFYTTHNPNFLDASRPDDIQIIRKNKENGTYKFEKNIILTNSSSKNDKFEIYTHFNPERNELFFANKVILVEGDSDKICFMTLCKEKWKLNLDQLGYSVIECCGKSGVNYFVGVCQLVGQGNYFAIWDQDDKEYNPKNKDLLSEIKNSDHGLEISGNLEKFLGLSTTNDNKKVENAYNWAMNVEVVPEKFLVVKSFLESKSVAEVNPTKSKD